MSSAVTKKQFITTEEVGREWRRLVSEGLYPDSADYDCFMARLGERDDWLYQTYGRPLMEQYPGKWVAISLNGDTLVRNTSGEAGSAGKEQFGDGGYTVRKLAEFPGHQLYH
jgi:hypothetical protein